MMEPVQLLGILVLLVLVLAIAAKLRSSKSVVDSLEEVDAGDEAGLPDDLPPPEAEEPMAERTERTFLSPESERLILATARTIIADEVELARWRAFDRVFLDRCLRKTPKGLVFDGAAFAALESEAQESLVRFGVAVYNACGKAAMETLGTQQRVFGRIAQVYLAALMSFRG